MSQQAAEAVCANCRCQGKLPDGRVVWMNRPMEFTGHYNVQGTPTHAYHCFGCNGRAHFQPRPDPDTGQARMVQVALRGSEEEYRPQKLDPRAEMQIPVAYTLGSAPQRRRMVQVGQLTTPEPAVLLDPRIGQGTVITPDHPFHPANVRKRIQPVRLQDLVSDR